MKNLNIIYKQKLKAVKSENPLFMVDSISTPLHSVHIAKMFWDEYSIDIQESIYALYLNTANIEKTYP